MEFSANSAHKHAELIALFAETFTTSDTAEEGALVAAVVKNLLTTTAPADLYVFTLSEGDTVIGAALFSRLRYAKDPRRVFILSPMAIATAYQGRGLGQSLLSQAHQTLGAAGVEIVITYGDPAFYAKTGYQPISTDVAKAPLPLSYPHGWIGQSLTEAAFTPLKGDCRCVAALNDPRIW